MSVTGTLISKGYTHFSIVDQDGVPLGAWSGATAAGHCMPYDTVSYNETKCTLIKARYTPLRLTGTLILNSKVRYGQTSRGVPLYLFQPENPAYPLFVVGSSSKDTALNLRILMEYDNWVSAGLPQGHIVQNYGPAGTKDAEEAVAKAVAQPPLPKEKNTIGNVAPLLPSDIPSLPPTATVFNIDPPGCEDIDDLFAIEELDENLMRIYILIAAAAAYVLPGSPADRAASLRSATLYTPDGTPLQHMLPPALATAAASLKADGVARPALAWSFIYNLKKETIVKNHEFALYNVTNAHSYSYDSVTADAPPHVTTILQALTRTLKGNDADTHSWVEVAMIAYNRALANFLYEQGVGVIRRHRPADEQRATDYARLGGPALAFYAYKAAAYVSTAAQDTAHAGLGLKLYTHGTSPLRRYADLYNQQCLLAVIYPHTYSAPAEPFDSAFHNKRSSALKSYARTIHFLDCLEDASHVLEGTIIEVMPAKKKVKLWMEGWGLVLSWRNAPEDLLKEGTIGLVVKVRYYLNKNAPNMKERFVFEVV